MKICRSIAEMRAACRQVRGAGRRLGFVPTMGALHAGHISLVRAARACCDVVAVSIFVNPLQFGPQEDYGRYPRSFEQDCQMLEAEGVDLVFAPGAEEMYPPGAVSYVTVEGMSERLCGRSRPGHFRGVTTVVSKLFHIVEPDAAFFGQKDAAQASILRRMVRDLDLEIEMVICPIVREPDGLAMSSRNAYLTAEQRRAATVLFRALERVQALFDAGERGSLALAAAALQVLGAETGVRADYVEVVDNDTLEPVAEVSRGALVAVAAWLGETRLIDNLLLPAKTTPTTETPRHGEEMQK